MADDAPLCSAPGSATAAPAGRRRAPARRCRSARSPACPIPPVSAQHICLSNRRQNAPKTEKRGQRKGCASGWQVWKETDVRAGLPVTKPWQLRHDLLQQGKNMQDPADEQPAARHALCPHLRRNAGDMRTFMFRPMRRAALSVRRLQQPRYKAVSRCNGIKPSTPRSVTRCNIFTQPSHKLLPAMQPARP